MWEPQLEISQVAVRFLGLLELDVEFDWLLLFDDQRGLARLRLQSFNQFRCSHGDLLFRLLRGRILYLGPSNRIAL